MIHVHDRYGPLLPDHRATDTFGPAVSPMSTNVMKAPVVYSWIRNQRANTAIIPSKQDPDDSRSRPPGMQTQDIRNCLKLIDSVRIQINIGLWSVPGDL